MASKLVIAIVFVFDIIAFGLAVAAEQRRSKANVVPDAQKEYTYCVYDSDIATGFGVGALLFLLASQILVMAASKCFCCGPALRPSGSRSCALVLFFFTWLAFLIAESCLLAGSVKNAYHTRYRTIFLTDTLSCQTLRKGVFAAGAAFVFFTAILSEFYYVSYAKSKDVGVPPY
ncbi:hypothetical protein HPP92_014111 [Vanilla planifolia]|uniref:Fiber protein Fb34 n=1 Tax=Vanilla planifolia TaxID=51239 RepID=A0A835QNT7_VANPL|nr:hypothetical protein HPP92_014092 [Vanilla planifolia]KAG0474425.1 hypothetical protein HPP92_014111 [Vanilla planifolia]